MRDISEEAALLADFDRYISTPSTQPPSPTFVRLTARYPSCDKDVLREILTSVNNDQHAAIQLLDASQTVAVDPERDRQIANRLHHAELRRPHVRRSTSHTTSASQSTASDAALAERLHRLELRRLSEADPSLDDVHRMEQRHRRNDTVVPLNRSALDHMVATLREIVVPALRAHFEELVLPDTHSASAGVEYQLNAFQVSGLSLPPHNIVVKAASDGKTIRVNVVNVFLELEVGRWSYQSKGFVPVKDAGTARVSVNGMSVALTLEPRWSHAGGTKIVITDCLVTIDGKVRMNIQGAAADWAYNAIAVVLKPLIVSYVKEAIAETVTKALAVHLSQWAFSRSLDEEQSANTARVEARQPNAPPSAVTAAE